MKGFRLLMSCLVCLLIDTNVQAQQDKKVRYEVETIVLYGASEKYEQHKITKSDREINAYGCQFVAFWKINEKWDSGVGIRVSKYTGFGGDIGGWLFTSKYKPFKKLSNLYIVTGFGGSLDGDDIIDIAFGFVTNIKKLVTVTGRLGYNYTGFERSLYNEKTIEYDEFNFHRHSLLFALGFSL